MDSPRYLHHNRVDFEKRVSRVRNPLTAYALHNDTQYITVLPFRVHGPVVPIHCPCHRPGKLELVSPVRGLEIPNGASVGSEEAQAALQVVDVVRIRYLASVEGERVGRAITVRYGYIEIADGAWQGGILCAIEVECPDIGHQPNDLGLKSTRKLTQLHNRSTVTQLTVLR